MEKLRISENGRYFVKHDGTPFTWLADTTWTMPQRLKWDDAEHLMQVRKNQGFTVLQIVALDPERDIEMRNPAGQKALFDGDLSRRNERYFEYLDYIIDLAEEYEFYVLLLPVWGQLVVGEDWGGVTYPKTVNESNVYEYSQWIANRYKERNNVLWCLGGDRQPIHNGVDYKNVWRLMAEGLAKGLTGKDLKYNQKDPAWDELLFTYHACHENATGECSSLSYWDGEEEAWIRFVMLQSGHGLKPKNYELIEKEYNNPHVRPVWDGEPAYEMMLTGWPPVDAGVHGTWMVRKRAYWAMLSGAFGHTYGHANVWNSIGEKEKNAISKLSWTEAIRSEGSYQMKNLRQIMDDLQLMTYIPAQAAMINPDDSLEQHAVISESPDADTLCVYLPSGGNRTLDLTKLPIKMEAEQLYGWWYNPSDGLFYDASNQETKQAFVSSYADKLEVKSPTEGEEKDWVLILKKQNADVPVVEKEYYDMKKAEEKKVFVW